MADTLTLERGDHVRSTEIEGIALWFIRHPALDCPSQQVGEWCECEPEIDTDTAIVVMVGDDREHRVATDSLTRLEEDEFCGGCGQTGCAHGR